MRISRTKSGNFAKELSIELLAVDQVQSEEPGELPALAPDRRAMILFHERHNEQAKGRRDQAQSHPCTGHDTAGCLGLEC